MAIITNKYRKIPQEKFIQNAEMNTAFNASGYYVLLKE